MTTSSFNRAAWAIIREKFRFADWEISFHRGLLCLEIKWIVEIWTFRKAVFHTTLNSSVKYWLFPFGITRVSSSPSSSTKMGSIMLLSGGRADWSNKQSMTLFITTKHSNKYTPSSHALRIIFGSIFSSRPGRNVREDTKVFWTQNLSILSGHFLSRIGKSSTPLSKMFKGSFQAWTQSPRSKCLLLPRLRTIKMWDILD